MTDAISVVRRFNRSYTQRIGALEDSFLGLGMPLGPARLLFEIGTEPATAQALRARLGLDSGYLSRLLRSLEREGLVAVVPDPADRRRRQVSLTEAGRERWAAAPGWLARSGQSSFLSRSPGKSLPMRDGW